MIPTTGFRPCFWYTYCHYMAGLFAIKNPTIDGDIYCLYVCIIHRVIILVCSGLLKNNERNSHLPWDIVWTCLRIYIAYLCTFSGVQKFLERINTSYVYIIIYIVCWNAIKIVFDWLPSITRQKLGAFLLQAPQAPPVRIGWRQGSARSGRWLQCRKQQFFGNIAGQWMDMIIHSTKNQSGGIHINPV